MSRALTLSLATTTLLVGMAAGQVLALAASLDEHERHASAMTVTAALDEHERRLGAWTIAAALDEHERHGW